jgi:hypothetical protein
MAGRLESITASSKVALKKAMRTALAHGMVMV